MTKNRSMYFIPKTYCNPQTKISNVVERNPAILLALENLEIISFSKESTFQQISITANINVNLLTLICNLHNGFFSQSDTTIEEIDIPVIINFLKNNHKYYMKEKYPEILGLIKQMKPSLTSGIYKVLNKYFEEYFSEVAEHIRYEENIAFPYFMELCSNITTTKEEYSGKEYIDHHSDIESKLESLESLLLYHVRSEGPQRRKLLISISELEYELKIHSFIEENILIPAAESIEKRGNNR